jgi:hypothetical protein
MVVSTVGPGSFTTLAVAGSIVPLPDTLWQLTNTNKPYEFWRVIGMVPKDEGTAEISCLKYDATLYDGLDDDPPEDPADIGPTPSPLSFPRVVPPPTAIVVDELVVNTEIGDIRSLELSWTDSPAEMLRGYDVLYRYNSGNWKRLPETPTAHKSVPVLAPGTFDIQVLAINKGGYRSEPAKITYEYVIGDAPIANPAGGNYAGAVTITSAIPDSVIYYTLDGTDPTDETNGGRFLYSAPVTVAFGTTLKACSQSLGHYSHVGTWFFSSTVCAAPAFSPPPDPHYPLTGSALATLTTATGGASMYYTLDGSTPTVASTLYTAPILLPAGHTTIQAITVKAGLSNSPVASARYNVRRSNVMAAGATETLSTAEVEARPEINLRTTHETLHTAEAAVKTP